MFIAIKNRLFRSYQSVLDPHFNLDAGVFCLMLVAFLLLLPEAAAQATGLGEGTSAVENTANNVLAVDGGGGFNLIFSTFTHASIQSARIIVAIMTGIAGTMVAFGLQDGKKVVWNFILAGGLALNFGDFAYHIWGSYLTAQAPTPDTIATSAKDFGIILDSKGATPILGPFTNMWQNIITRGCLFVKPVAFKICILLMVIEASFKLALDLVEGDKVKYLVTLSLKCGFYLFLIENWWGGNINLMGNLCKGFEQLGLNASGVNGFSADSMWENAFTVVYVIWGDKANGIKGIGDLSLLTNPAVIIMGLVAIVICVACFFLAALEIFMAKIEFYTMALCTLPLIPFGMSKYTNFLWEKSVSTMFNCAIKVFVISFLGAVCGPFLKQYVDTFKSTTGGLENLAIIFEFVFACVMLVAIIKKIPQLVQGLLSGSPNLGGSDMKSAVAGAAMAAGGGAAALSAAHQAAKNESTGGGNFGEGARQTFSGLRHASPSQVLEGVGNMVNGTMAGQALKAGARSAYHQNPVAKGHQKGIEGMFGKSGLLNPRSKGQSVDRDGNTAAQNMDQALHPENTNSSGGDLGSNPNGTNPDGSRNPSNGGSTTQNSGNGGSTGGNSNGGSGGSGGQGGKDGSNGNTGGNGASNAGAAGGKGKKDEKSNEKDSKKKSNPGGKGKQGKRKDVTSEQTTRLTDMENRNNPWNK